MNLNARFFATHDHRHRRPTAGYRSPLHEHVSMANGTRASLLRTQEHESFLPVINGRSGADDGQKPFYRNDFANNHVFVAKHQLANILRNQSIANVHPGQRQDAAMKSPRRSPSKHEVSTSLNLLETRFTMGEYLCRRIICGGDRRQHGISTNRYRY